MHSSFPPKDAAVFCILNAYSPPSEPGAVGQLKRPPVMSFGPLYLGNPLLGRETCIKRSLMISGRVGENKDAEYTFVIYRVGYIMDTLFSCAITMQSHYKGIPVTACFYKLPHVSKTLLDINKMYITEHFNSTIDCWETFPFPDDIGGFVMVYFELLKHLFIDVFSHAFCF